VLERESAGWALRLRVEDGAVRGGRGWAELSQLKMGVTRTWPLFALNLQNAGEQS
jgi:hypothetical protein